jgi:hypothetical protein
MSVNTDDGRHRSRGIMAANVDTQGVESACEGLNVENPLSETNQICPKHFDALGDHGSGLPVHCSNVDDDSS